MKNEKKQMQSEDDRVLLVCLCGIPGAGKTTFARSLSQQHQPAVVVSFDEFSSRALALNAVSAALSSSPPGGTVVADHTNYYRSMRRELRRLARDSEALFVEVALDPPLAECLARNDSRVGPARIDPALVVRMHARFERPPDGREATLSLQELRRGATVPRRPKEREIETVVVGAREQNDLRMRREISARVAAAPPEQRAALAAELNRVRREELAAARREKEEKVSAEKSPE